MKKYLGEFSDDVPDGLLSPTLYLELYDIVWFWMGLLFIKRLEFSWKDQMKEPQNAQYQALLDGLIGNALRWELSTMLTATSHTHFMMPPSSICVKCSLEKKEPILVAEWKSWSGHKGTPLVAVWRATKESGGIASGITSSLLRSTRHRYGHKRLCSHEESWTNSYWASSWALLCFEIVSRICKHVCDYVTTLAALQLWPLSRQDRPTGSAWGKSFLSLFPANRLAKKKRGRPRTKEVTPSKRAKKGVDTSSAGNATTTTPLHDLSIAFSL